MPSMIQMLVKDVESVKKTLGSRAAAGGGNNAALQMSFGESFIKQITLLKIVSTDDATTLMDSLKDSPYGDDMTKRILAVIDGKLQDSAIVPPGSMGCHIQGQFLKEWWAYQTQEDWDFYRDPKKFFSAKMTRMVERALLLGCTYPDEQAIKWMLATLLLSHYDEMPPPREIFNKLKELKQTFASERKTSTCEKLILYPSSPHDLPKDIFNSAYPEGGPQPVLVELSGISVVADQIPLRRSSHLLKTDGADVGPSWQNMKSAIKGSTEQLLNLSHGASVVTQGLKPVKQELASPANILELNAHGMASAVKQEPNAHDGGIGCDMVQVPAPKGPHEEHLLAQYKSDVWRHRAQQQGILAGSAYAHPSSAENSLQVSKSPDGTLLLNPRCASLDVVAPSKAESPIKSETPMGAPDGSEAQKGAGDGGADDLDDYARAALKALQTRQAKKKDELATKLKQERQAKAKAKAEMAWGAAKPHVKVQLQFKSQFLKAKGQPKAEGGRVKVELASSSDAAKACPIGESAPMLYKGGIIYTVDKHKKFRALKEKGDKYTETAVGWGKKRTKQEAWTTVVNAIDKHYAVKATAKAMKLKKPKAMKAKK